MIDGWDEDGVPGRWKSKFILSVSCFYNTRRREEGIRGIEFVRGLGHARLVVSDTAKRNTDFTELRNGAQSTYWVASPQSENLGVKVQVGLRVLRWVERVRL